MKAKMVMALLVLVVLSFAFRPASAVVLGDVNGDGKVDGKDVALVAKHFGINYDPLYDLNNDGKIDGKDLAIVAANFGKQG